VAALSPTYPLAFALAAERIMGVETDTTRMRTTAKGLKPFVMTNLKTLSGLAEVVAFIETKGMLLPAAVQ